jgi:adenylate cyclase
MELTMTARIKQADFTHIQQIVEWLAGDECHAMDDGGLAAGLGCRLRAANLPLDRLSLHLRPLDPELLGRTIAWAPEEPVEIHKRKYGIELSPPFVRNPISRVQEKRESLVLRVDEQSDDAWLHVDIFEGRRLVEFVFIPLVNTDGSTNVVSFATTSASGFSAADRAAFRRIAPALRYACEVRTLLTTQRALLDTYVGTKTARRVLAGLVRRGEVETLEAALMLCDLRGFTELSNRLPSERVLELLNAYFDCIVPAINEAGGEVIKFMGDSVLAYFHRENAFQASAACLQGASTALENLKRLTMSDAELHAGIALHYGEVSYGNIGYGHRLDFTLIGRDVNLVSRIQGVCSMTGHALLMSERFARLLGRARTSSIGRYELKGFADLVELHTIGNEISPYMAA